MMLVLPLLALFSLTGSLVVWRSASGRADGCREAGVLAAAGATLLVLCGIYYLFDYLESWQRSQEFPLNAILQITLLFVLAVPLLILAVALFRRAHKRR
jgi:ABC-type Fe3+ transport system permease subunit